MNGCRNDSKIWSKKGIDLSRAQAGVELWERGYRLLVIGSQLSGAPGQLNVKGQK